MTPLDASHPALRQPAPPPEPGDLGLACRAVLFDCDGVPATDVLDAVLSLLPLEQADPDSAWRMIADGDPGKVLPVFAEFEAIVDRHVPGRRVTAIEPDEFKDRARAAFAVVVTGERRLYGGIVLRKGVLAPEAV